MKKVLKIIFELNRGKVAKILHLLLLLVLVIFLVPFSTVNSIDLKSKSGDLVFLNVADYGDDGLEKFRIFLNSLLGTALHINQYDVCFSAKQIFYINKNKFNNVKLAINIVPISDNQSIISVKDLVKQLVLTNPNDRLADFALEQIVDTVYFIGSDGKEINSMDRDMPGVMDHLLQTSIFVNPNSTLSCKTLSFDQKGFVYMGNIFLLEQNNNEFPKQTQLKFNENDPMLLESATLSLRPNIYALFGRRIALFILIFGFLAFIKKMLFYVIKDDFSREK